MLPGQLTAADLYRLTRDVPWMILDYETTGLDIVDDRPVGICVGTPRGEGYLPLEPYPTLTDPVLHAPEDKEKVAEILRGLKHVPWINWNVKFDMHFHQKLVGNVPDSVIDPMIALWLLAEDADFDEKGNAGFVVGEELGDFKDLMKRVKGRYHGVVDQERETWAKLQKAQKLMNLIPARKKAEEIFPYPTVDWRSVALEEWIDYGLGDSLYPGLLWFEYFRPTLAREGNLLAEFYTYEMPFLRQLWEMEHKGVAVDEEYLDRLDEEFLSTFETEEAEVFKAAGREFNINSDDQLKAILFDEMGVKPSGRKTKTGRDSLDAKAFKVLAERESQMPIFQALMKRAKAEKQYQFTQAMKSSVRHGRIHTRYKQHGTVSGRLSSADPNLQNIPSRDKIGKQLRQVFVASPGHKLIVADYSQAELRTLADRTQDPKLIEVYSDLEADIHAQTAAALGVPRPVAKTANFGIVYGLGAKSLRENLLFDAGIDLPQRKCGAIIKGLYETYARIKPWKAEMVAEAKEKGYVETRLGRRRHVVGLDHWDDGIRSYAERQCANTPIQGDVADLVRVAMNRVGPAAERVGAAMLLQIHDEVVLECPDEIVDRTALMVKDIMQSVWPNFTVPILAEVGTGPNWGEGKH